MPTSNSFWTLTAQIVPVLGLALILEARMLAVRFSKPEKRLEKDSRVRSGFAIFGAAILLTIVFVAALLFSVPAPFFKPIAGSLILQLISVFILLYAALMVVIVPANLYFDATTKAAVARFHNRFPWSRARRKLRAVDQLREAAESQMRKARQDRIQFRLTLLSFVRYEQFGLAPELVFDPVVYCTLHRQKPCETHIEHYLKTIQTMETIALLLAEGSDLIDTFRASLLRFIVTGTSEIQEVDAQRKLEKLRGTETSIVVAQKLASEQNLLVAKRVETKLRDVIEGFRADS